MEQKQSYNPYVITSVNELSAQEAKSQIKKCSTRNSLLLLTFFVLMILSSYLLGKTKISGESTELLYYLFIYVLAFPLVLFLGNRGQKNTVKTYFQKPKVDGKWWFNWSCIAFTCGILINIVGLFVFRVIDIVNQNNGSDELNYMIIAPSENSVFYLICFFLAIGICAPIFEELLLRGSCLTHTLPYGQWFSFIVIGVSFGLLHGNFQQMFYATVIGMFNGFIAFKAKSIIPAIGTHMFVNIPNAILTICLSKIDVDKLTKLSETSSDGSYTTEQANDLMKFVGDNSFVMFILFAVFLFIVVIFFMGLSKLIRKLRFYRDEFICGNTCPVLSNGQKILAYLSSPATIVLFAILIFYAFAFAIFGR
ncbi:hypothetical protein FACS1894132_14560 [Clostridia bacterium]|nr:hypothetical protein FACS1894132_14560 [Clostridia bacterium]